MGLLIQGGEIVTAESRRRGDLFIEGETIRAIGTGLSVPPGTEVIDAAGKLVFPGFIDPHVHIHLPCMDTFARETHAAASVAALIGGTTTFIEMCGPNRNGDALEAYHVWKQKAEGNSACDYAFHMGVARYDAKTEAQLGEIVRDGTASFKVYLAYKDLFGLNDEELFHALQLAARLGVITAAHCENAELISQLQQRLQAKGKTGPEWHEPSRPEAVEAEGVSRFAAFVEQTGATGYVVHLSCAPALRVAVEAKMRGVRLYTESVLPHLLLDKSYAERAGVEGMKYVLSPPLRDRRNLPVLWNALQTGLIDTVGTDHCPFDTEQKRMGAKAFTRIPNGLPGIEDRVNLVYTYGVKRGGLDPHRFVDALSTRPAKLFGLYPRKGAIAVGADADLVVYDAAYRGRISAATEHGINDYSAFEGFAIEGRPAVVTVRGKVQVRDGAFVGEQGRGRMLKREPQYRKE